MAGHYLFLPSHPPPLGPGSQVRPGMVRHAHGGEFANRLPFSAGGDVRVLSQGGRAPVGVEGHLWRHDALHDSAMPRLVPCHLVPPDCPVVPQLAFWAVAGECYAAWFLWPCAAGGSDGPTHMGGRGA